MKKQNKRNFEKRNFLKSTTVFLEVEMLRPSKLANINADRADDSSSRDELSLSNNDSTSCISSGTIRTSTPTKHSWTKKKRLRIRKDRKRKRHTAFRFLFASRPKRKEEIAQRVLSGLFLLVLIFIYLRLNSRHNEVSNSQSERQPSLRNKKDALQKSNTSNENFDISSNTTTKSGNISNYNDDSMIHIVNTRFMQHQANLTTLATARLHLFKTFCLPSMIKQTKQNFYWIIKIDPDLDKSIKNQLIGLVEVYGNVYVIGSNENFMVGTTPGSWRGGQESYSILQSIQQGHVHTGNIAKLQFVASKSNMGDIILETRLDADDGLNHRYFEFVQMDAKRRFIQGKHDMNDKRNHPTKWFFWCIEKHAKWYPTRSYEIENNLGNISGERRLDFCVTPGLTVGYNAGTTSDDVPYFPHHMLFNQLVVNRTVAKLHACGDHQCMTFITKMVAAVRSRTHTSAGMADVEYNSKLEMGADMTNWIWRKLKDEFGIKEKNIMKMHQYLNEHVKEIAKENLEGQCTDGHSCKQGSKDRLQKLIGAR